MSALKLHQLMIIGLIRKFNEDGLVIKAASYFGDFDIPKKIGNYQPDIIALSQDDTLHIGEAKLSDNLNSEVTKDEFLEFSNTKSPNGSPAHLHIVVEKKAEEQLKELLEEWEFKKNTTHIWTF